MPPRAAALLAGGLTALVVTGCGVAGPAPAARPAPTSASGPPGNGELARSGPQVSADAVAALTRAGAAHLQGSSTGVDGVEQFDLQLQGADAAGSVTLGGQTTQIVVASGRIYLNAPAAFWRTQGVPASPAHRLGGRWVTVPDDGSLGLIDLTLPSLAGQLRLPVEAADADRVTAVTVGGRPAVRVTQSDGSTLDVEGVGEPYPVQVVDAGDQPGTLTFSAIGVRAPVTAPSGARSVSSLIGG